MTKILLLATSRESISVVDDQMGSPTWTMDLAGALLHLSRTEQEGLYHYAAKGSASRYEVAKHIAAIKNLDCEISPCDSSAFPAPAQRPLNSRFDCSKFDEEIGISRPAWRDSLTMYLEHS